MNSRSTSAIMATKTTRSTTATSLSVMSRLLRFYMAAVLILLPLCLPVNCGKFDLRNVVDPIPREWEQKLDELKLQNAMSHNVRMAKREYEMALSLEEYVLSTGISVADKSSSYALLLDNWPSEAVKELDKAGHLLQKLSSQFVHSTCISNGIPHKYCASYISRLTIPNDSSVAKQCASINSRSKDAPGQPYRRLLPADYSDGLEKPRRTKHNHQLPSPRNISNIFYESSLENVNEILESSQYSPEGKLDRSRSVFFAQWSQFVEHDLVHTVQHKHDNGKPVECCKDNKLAAPRSTSSSCSPIHVSDKDPYYRQFFLNCLNYVRSAITVDPNCKLGAINQLNMASDYLDLSQIYGTEETSDKLRLHEDGKLNTESQDNINIDCLIKNSSCVHSGDSRVNVSPYMIVQHAIFQQSHNNIAQQLKDLHPTWTDEKLFQLSRKINRALFQKITYEEWLPMVVGHRMGIQIRTSNEEMTTVRGVSNEFATAAIRFYNSMLPGDLYDHEHKNHLQKKLFELRDTFYQPEAFNWTQETRTKIVASTLAQKAMALDISYVDDLNVDLYRAKNGPDGDTFGTDSLALDIMRSRDHGLTGYVHYLEACHKRMTHESPTSWEELASRFSAGDLELLRKTYRHIEDIDLIVGAIAELPENDSLVGPTLRCIIGEQMDKSRRSDPSFYSMDHRLMQTVQNYSAANLLCDTMNLVTVQADVFQIPSQHGRNPIVCCDELNDGLNLSPWTDAD